MTRNLAQDLESFDRDGYLILENVIEPELVEEIRTALIRTEDDNDIGFRTTKFEGKRTIRIYNLLVHGETFWKIPVHDAVLPVAEAILDAELQLSSLSSITLCPGQEAQSLHADDQLLPIPKPHQPFSLNCVWAISDFTEANGATRIVPGSHKADDQPSYDMATDTIAAEMPAGSVVLWHGSLWHAGGANTTTERRYTIANYYCSGFFRPQENQQLGVPTEIAKQFPRRLQELCGYSVYKGLYGHVDNEDPIVMLDQESVRKMTWARGRED